MQRTARGGADRAPARWLVAGALACGLLAAAGPADAVEETAGRPAGARPPCTSEQLVADGAQRIGVSGFRITVVNEGPGACVLKGHPAVALAGQGSPDRNKPLDVVREGRAGAVRLEAGDRAWTRLTFTPVLGEAGGYCDSGAEPGVAPSVVLGVGGGGLQLAPDDGGNFALCDDAVRATAFRPASP